MLMFDCKTLVFHVERDRALNVCNLMTDTVESRLDALPRDGGGW
jgi:hypothetical protein